jgi:hypothetical protein
MKKKVEKKENTKYGEISHATDSGISATKRKINRTQHMVDMKQTLRTKEKITMEMYDAPKKCSALEKGPTVEKVKKIARQDKKARIWHL